MPSVSRKMNKVMEANVFANAMADDFGLGSTNSLDLELASNNFIHSKSVVDVEPSSSPCVVSKKPQ